MQARTHAHTHARTHARTYARKHARTHARTHTHTHTHTCWFYHRKKIHITDTGFAYIWVVEGLFATSVFQTILLLRMTQLHREQLTGLQLFRHTDCTPLPPPPPLFSTVVDLLKKLKKFFFLGSQKEG